MIMPAPENPVSVGENPLQRCRDVIDKAVEKIRQLLDWLGRELDNLVLRRVLPGFKLMQVYLEGALKWHDRLMQEIAKLVSQPGNPVVLSTAGHFWSDTVQKKASAQAGMFTELQMGVDNWWSGGAAAEYIDLLPAQGQALSAVGEQAAGIGKAMETFSAQVITYWTSIAREVVAGATEVTNKVGESISPQVVGGVTGVVMAVVKAVANLIVVAVEKFAEFRTTMSEVRAVTNDWSAFPGMEWPRAGAYLGHGRWRPGEQV